MTLLDARARMSALARMLRFGHRDSRIAAGRRSLSFDLVVSRPGAEYAYGVGGPGMAEQFGSAKRYRERAEELRAEASAITSEGTKQAVLDIAADYERLANSIDASAARRSNSTSETETPPVADRI